MIPFDPIDTHRANINLTQLAHLVGVTTRTIHRWRNNGIPNEPTADRLAIAIGRLTHELWPHLTDHAINEVTATCAWEPCSNEFIPTRPGHMYCRQRCANYASQARNRDRRLAAKRQRYANDPDYRAAKQAASKEYKNAAKKALSAYDRQYRQANDERIRARRRRWYQANAEQVKAAERNRYAARKNAA